MEEQSNDEEYIACFDINDLKQFHTGKLDSLVFPKTYAEAHEKKINHIIIRLFARSIDGRYLVQKRSQNKKVHRGRWTDSASGHVRYNVGNKEHKFEYKMIEDSVKRELKEEMGCDLLNLRFIDLKLEDLGEERFELAYYYIGIVGDELNFDEEEVDPASGLLSLNELEDILAIESPPKPWVESARKMWKRILDHEFDEIFNQMLEELFPDFWSIPGIEPLGDYPDLDLIRKLRDNNPAFLKRIQSQINSINNRQQQQPEVYSEMQSQPHSITHLTTKKESNSNSKTKSNSVLYNRGLIIGRFQPFHLGHLALIKKCSKYVNTLVIGIGSSQFSDVPLNPLSFDERKLLIELTLADEPDVKSDIEIEPIPDQFNINTWIDYIFDNIPDFDCIFTNNLWIGRLFQNRKKRILTGPEFKFDMTKYNGTAIRELMYKGIAYWVDLVPKPVAKYLSERDIQKRLRKLKNL